MPPYGTNNKWTDRSHPQTLYLATVLLYVNAVYWILELLLIGGVAIPIFALLGVGAVFAGLGLANEKKAGYWLALVVAALNLLFWVAWFLLGGYASISVVINVLFAAALMGLLVHPMTRSYKRIWFKKLNGR